MRFAGALGASALLHAWLIESIALRPPAAPPAPSPLSVSIETPPAREREPDAAALPVADTERAAGRPAPAAERKPQPRRAEPPTPALAVTAALPPDPTFYPAAQLDRFPQELSRLKPAYPERADAAGVVSGEVTLLLLIDESGAVNDASVVEAKPEGYFEESALAWALERARFTPAQRNGRSVKSRVLVKVSYSPEPSQPK